LFSLDSFLGGFERYVPFIMRMLVEASQAKFEQVDFGTIDYLNALRLSILDTYTGIIAGLADGGKVILDLLYSHLFLTLFSQISEFRAYIPPIIALLDLIANDPDRDTAVLSSAVGLIGDLAQNLGESLKPFISAPCIQVLISLGSINRYLFLVFVNGILYRIEF
jgi:importin subunit beta-1